MFYFTVIHQKQTGHDHTKPSKPLRPIQCAVGPSVEPVRSVLETTVDQLKSPEYCGYSSYCFAVSVWLSGETNLYGLWRHVNVTGSGLTCLGLNFCPESIKSMSSSLSLFSFLSFFFKFRLHRRFSRVSESRALLPLLPRWHGDDRWAATGVCLPAAGTNEPKQPVSLKVGFKLVTPAGSPEQGPEEGDGSSVLKETERCGDQNEETGDRTHQKGQQEWWKEPHLFSHDSLRDGTPRSCTSFSLRTAEVELRTFTKVKVKNTPVEKNFATSKTPAFKSTTSKSTRYAEYTLWHTISALLICLLTNKSILYLLVAPHLII